MAYSLCLYEKQIKRSVLRLWKHLQTINRGKRTSGQRSPLVRSAKEQIQKGKSLSPLENST